MIRLRLDLTDELRLLVGNEGAVRLVYSPVRSLELSLGVRFRGAIGTSDVRLDEHGFARDGVYRSTLIPIELGVEWRPLGRERLSVTLRGGLIAYQKLEIDDERGHSLTDVHADPAGYLSFELRWSF
jgi:hypothetical protein